MKKISSLGSGTYGLVYKIKSEDENKDYAFKRNVGNSSDFFSEATRELSILHRLRNHPRIVCIEMVSLGSPYDRPLSPSRKGKSDDQFHFVFELGESNLSSYIKKNILSLAQVKQFMVDILLGLEFIHSSEIIHRDFKPDNVIIFSPDKSASEFFSDGEDEKVKINSPERYLGPDLIRDLKRAKICDFGLSKYEVKDGICTPDVTTSWYRAPEIISGLNYSYESDLWSLGCTFYELIFGSAFISPERDDKTRLRKAILDSLPAYEKIELEKSLPPAPKSAPGSSKTGSFLDSVVPNSKAQKLLSTFSKDDKDSTNLILSRLLNLDPSKRISATDCLKLSFFDEYREYINQSKKIYPGRPQICYTYAIVPDPRRDIQLNNLRDLYNDRANNEWYSHRKIFHCIDIFDRIIRYKNRLGVEISDNDFALYFFSSLIISIKYFSSLQHVSDMLELLPEAYCNEANYKRMKKIQIEIMRDIVSYNLYRTTAYESIFKKPRSKEKASALIRESLVRIIDNDNVNGLNPDSLIAQLEKNIRNEND